jgi:hypothetical protein
MKALIYYSNPSPSEKVTTLIDKLASEGYYVEVTSTLGLPISGDTYDFIAIDEFSSVQDINAEFNSNIITLSAEQFKGWDWEDKSDYCTRKTKPYYRKERW